MEESRQGELLLAKIEKVAGLVADLTGPMATTLVEVRKSNRSRWFVLVAMIVCTSLCTFATLHTLKRLDHMSGAVVLATAELQQLQGKSETSAQRLDSLIGLAIDNASSPEIARSLTAIANIEDSDTDPTTSQK